MTVDEIVGIVGDDCVFYENSGGGVTVSGGEPFVQYSGLRELLKALKEKNISIAIETTGDTDWEKIESIIQYVDFFLFDVKHSDADLISKITKGNGERILKNLEKLAEKCAKKIIMRVPVIPDFNYSDDVLESIICIGERLGISEIDLLPYHTLGVSKYRQLGVEYQYPVTKMMNKKELQRFIQTDSKRQIRVQVGG
jgi:pyruvate formate lyase activating enzyme